MSYIKRQLNNYQYELNTALGDQVAIRITDMNSGVVVADYSRPMSEELIDLLESELAHKSLIDVVCLKAQERVERTRSFKSNFEEQTQSNELVHLFSAN